jgi:hypothetical protein
MVVDMDGDGDFADEAPKRLVQSDGHLFSGVVADSGGVIHTRGIGVGPQGFNYAGNIAGLQLAGSVGSDVDEYALTLEAGEVLGLSTMTPADGPFEFVNELDPALELIDPDGNVVAFDDNGAGEHNALIDYTAEEGGTYLVRVLAVNDSAGEYVLEVDPNQPPLVEDGDLELNANPIWENDIVDLTVSFTDPNPGDTHQIVIVWGDEEPDTVVDLTGGERTVTVSHQYLDDGLTPGGSPTLNYPIDVTVTDGGGLSDSASTSITVNNVDPIITEFSNSDATFENKFQEGEEVTFTAEFSDVGTLDTHTVTINWDDGTEDTVIPFVASGGAKFFPKHTFNKGGVFTVTLTVTDDDTGTDVETTTAVVIGAGVNGNVLQIVGSDEDNNVSVNTQGKDQYKVHADFFPEGNHRTFDAADIKYIQIWMCNGDDQASIAGNIPVPASIYGGGGNDHLNGGGARNILIGGPDEDRLVGGGDDDILIGGWTDYDFNDAALLALLDEWNSGDDYPTRVANLRDPDVLPDGTLIALLADEEDTPGTVHDDGAPDKLTGSSGLDWYFFDPDDDDTDRQDNKKTKEYANNEGA